MKDEKIITTMRLPKSLLKALSTKAAAEGRSRSNYVEHVLRRDVGKAALKKERGNVLD